jgi:hypothetical protein
MISVPEKLQLQISDALSIIAASDFPEEWETLLPVNKQHFTIDNILFIYIYIIGTSWQVESY